MRELDVSDLFEHLDEDGNPKVPAPEQITSTPPLPLNGHTTNSVDLCSTEPESSTELLDSIHTVPVSCANDDVWGFKDTSLPKHNVFLSPRPDQPEQSTSSTVAHGNTPPVSSSQLIAPLDKIHKDPHESLNNNPIPTDTTYPHDPTKRSKHSTPPPWGKSQISPPMDHMSRQDEYTTPVTPLHFNQPRLSAVTSKDSITPPLDGKHSPSSEEYTIDAENDRPFIKRPSLALREPPSHHFMPTHTSNTPLETVSTHTASSDKGGKSRDVDVPPQQGSHKSEVGSRPPLIQSVRRVPRKSKKAISLDGSNTYATTYLPKVLKGRLSPTIYDKPSLKDANTERTGTFTHTATTDDGVINDEKAEPVISAANATIISLFATMCFLSVLLL
ncbi:hypothetical protein BASA61_009919 [Batrachochytrium salamandrivorans]|nr:hypothetical protein BASA61_009919 [Batrachochytrium salamandrivorans]